jgi:hypothetical protein
MKYLSALAVATAAQGLLYEIEQGILDDIVATDYQLQNMIEHVTRDEQYVLDIVEMP